MKKRTEKKAKKQDKGMAETVKQIEKALFALKFYPVAVDERSKEEAKARLQDIYEKGNDTIRQLVLYMVHENMAEASNFKVMHTNEFFKMKSPESDQSKTRMKVYRAIFNHNTSLEGITELAGLLGRLNSDDSAKLLTYHFSYLCTSENEASHMLRAAIIEALGETDSLYALHALLEYARNTDNERTFHRIVGALMEWEEKLEKLELKPKKREELRMKLREVVTRELSGSHYG